MPVIWDPSPRHPPPLWVSPLRCLRHRRLPRLRQGLPQSHHPTTSLILCTSIPYIGSQKERKKKGMMQEKGGGDGCNGGSNATCGGKGKVAEKSWQPHLLRRGQQANRCGLTPPLGAAALTSQRRRHQHEPSFLMILFRNFSTKDAELHNVSHVTGARNFKSISGLTLKFPSRDLLSIANLNSICLPQQDGSGVRATHQQIHKLHIGTFALPLLQGWGSAAFVPPLTMRLGTELHYPLQASCSHRYF